jgi:hypothetical protein
MEHWIEYVKEFTMLKTNSNNLEANNIPFCIIEIAHIDLFLNLP